MLTTHLNLFDVCVISVMLLSCLFAFYRGFVREILSLGAWVGAGIVTLYYFQPMAAKFQPHVKNPMVAGAFGTLAIYIVALIGFSIINMFILKFVKSGSDVGMLDNMVGLFFGAFRGALIVSLAFFMLTMAYPSEREYPDWLKAALTRPYAEKGAIMLVNVAPEYLREISALEKKATAGATRYSQPQETVTTTTSGTVTSTASNSTTTPETGYNAQTTHQLDRILGNTDSKQ